MARRQLANGGPGARGAAGGRRRKPQAIDNSHLLAAVHPNLARIQSITSEGGRLRRDLLEGRDFKILPKSLWNALQQWYGVGVALPRQVRLRVTCYLLNIIKQTLFERFLFPYLKGDCHRETFRA